MFVFCCYPQPGGCTGRGQEIDRHWQQAHGHGGCGLSRQCVPGGMWNAVSKSCMFGVESLTNCCTCVPFLHEVTLFRAEKYGDTADECGEAFFLCGKALLELAR